MAVTVQSLGLDKLSFEEKVALAEELSEHIAAEMGQQPLTDAERQMLDERIAEDDADPDDVVPWEVVKAEALARCRK